MHANKLLLMSALALFGLQGCTYNHYYQNDGEMMATPAGETAMAKPAPKPTKKVVIYRVH